MLLLSSKCCRQLSARALQHFRTRASSGQLGLHAPSIQAANQLLRVTPTASCAAYRTKGYQSTRDSNFKEIYRFKYITFTRLVSNLKVYQTALTVFATPFVIYFQSTGQMATSEATVFLGITSFACLMLFIMSDFFRRIACVIYLNEKTNTVDISHMTFWARRNDVRISVDNIKPLSDSSEKASSTFVRLETYNSNLSFFLFLKHGIVKEPEHLKNLVGIMKV